MYYDEWTKGNIKKKKLNIYHFKVAIEEKVNPIHRGRKILKYKANCVYMFFQSLNIGSGKIN